MADDPAQAAEPNEFQQYMQQFAQQQAAQAQQVSAQLEQLSQRQEQLAQYVASTTKNLPTIPADAVEDKINEKLLREFFNDPKRVFAEFSEITRQQQAQIADAKLQAYDQQRRAEMAHGQFWGGFMAENPDIPQFLIPVVQNYFDRLPTNMDNSQRADAAAARVREEMAAAVAAQSESARTQAAGANMTATASGTTDASQRPQTPQREVGDKELHDSGIDELVAWQNKRMVYG